MADGDGDGLEQIDVTASLATLPPADQCAVITRSPARLHQILTPWIEDCNTAHTTTTAL